MFKKIIHDFFMISISVSVPSVKPLPSRTVRSGRSLKLKCKLLGPVHPPPAISWFKDSRKLNPSQNVHIQTKK